MKIKTISAQCAALIRQELKANFPQTKFKVTSSNYSMGDSVNVSWTNGAAHEQVEQLLAKYQYGRFNGMEDVYESTNRRDDIAQTKYLFCDREISNEIYLAKFEELKETWEILREITDINATNNELFAFCNCWTARQFVYQRADGFRKVDFTPKEEPKKEEIKPAPQVFDNVVEIVNYSEKAIAVFGDTKPMKDKLKALGGRFNPFLNNNGEKMAGWIFSKTKSTELYQLLNAAV
jgi:hypothetical protein